MLENNLISDFVNFDLQSKKVGLCMINGEDIVEKRRQSDKEKYEIFVTIILSSIFAITIACMIWIDVTHRRNYQYDGAYVDKNQTMWEIE